MATSVTLNSTSYSIPAVGEDNWGTDVSNYLIALSTGVLSKAGGAFTLTAEVDFGATYGLKAAYFKSRGTVASTGIVRLANAESVVWRNAANSADLALTVNSSNALQFNASSILIAGAASIVNADVSASAAIAYSKLAALTASRALVSDGSGVVSVSSVTSTELGYVSGVTSAIQTQIDTKAAKASPTFSGTVLLQNSSGSQPELHLSEDPDNGTNVVKIKAPATLGADYTLTLPTDDGAANQVLSTDGSGVLSWASPFTNPMTTTGDIVYSSDGSGTPARLAIGASSTVLVGGTTPSWSAITNTHVSASAAIAGTKISPSFGEQNIAAAQATGVSNTLTLRSGASANSLQLATLDSGSGLAALSYLNAGGSAKLALGFGTITSAAPATPVLQLNYNSGAPLVGINEAAPDQVLTIKHATQTGLATLGLKLSNTRTVTAGGSEAFTFPSGRGLVLVSQTGNGYCAMYFVRDGNGLTEISDPDSYYSITSSPGAGLAGVGWNNGTKTFTIYQGTGSNIAHTVMFLSLG